MSFVFRTLTHPVAPIAWWALNTPEVTNTIAMSLGVDALGRRLEELEEAREERKYMIFVLIGATVAAVVIPIIAWIIVGSSYKKGVTDKRPSFPQPIPPELSLAGKDFKYPLCAFKDDCTYCMHGWCLEPVRAADNYQSVQAAPYWTVMGAFILTWIAAQVIGFGLQMGVRMVSADMGMASRMQGNIGSLGWFVANACLAMYLAGLRRALREKFGDTNAGKNFCSDWMLYWWCSCCVVIQEARQVDEAEGVRVECCCKLIKTMASPMEGSGVGGVVVVGQQQIA